MFCTLWCAIAPRNCACLSHSSTWPCFAASLFAWPYAHSLPSSTPNEEPPPAPPSDPMPQLKEALTKLRVRSNHCVEKSELVALYRLHASGSTLPAAAGTMPTRPTPHSNSAPAASPAAAAAPASRSASSGGGTYINGRYVPAGGAGGAGSLLGVSWQTIAIGVFAAVYM